MTPILQNRAGASPVLLDDALVDQAVRTFPLSRRHDVHFADAEIVLQSRHRRTALGASALSIGRNRARAKCKSELLERWAHHLWLRAGSPALAATGLCTGQPSRLTSPAGAVRADATGLCAGPRRHQEQVVLHGLLEALERDAVTTLLDGGEGAVRSAHADAPNELHALARRWRGTFHLFAVAQRSMPATVIAVFVTDAADAGAIGTACRLTEQDACAHAAAEALMMFTTARHWSRQPSTPDAYTGIAWASSHVTQLLDELNRHRHDTRDTPPAPPFGGLAQVAAATRRRFGAEPRFAELPTPQTALDGLGVWWVSVPGARTPATATRTPWPLG